MAAAAPEFKPVRDDVPKVDGKIAVGEDLAFQRKWWRFEKFVWSFFVLVLIADLLGLLGRGPLANANARSADGSLHLKYERTLRENTPSIVTILPGSNAIEDGKVRVFVSDSVVKQLGAQRIIPQPEVSEVGNGGVTYTFPAKSNPITIQVELKSSFLGLQPFQIGIPGHPPLDVKSFVLP